MVTSDSVLNNLNYLLFAQGSYSLTPDVLLTYHTFRQLSNQTVNLLNCRGIIFNKNFNTKLMRMHI
jgi:hypothetical protein